MAFLPEFKLGTSPVQVLNVTAKLACSVRGVSLLHSLQGTDLALFKCDFTIRETLPDFQPPYGREITVVT
jgi:hypothetical protein